jgi:hypothetical protein
MGDFILKSLIKNSFRHLREGGSVLIFPSGTVDPDPALFSNAPLALDD